jgi:hypothetical protein
VKVTRQIVNEVFGYLVEDRITMKKIPNEVDANWNDIHKMPNTQTEEIT